MRVERILANNPGPFTGPGTNTYLVGDDLGLVVLDPGPIDPRHEQAIVGAIADRRVEAVVVTHTHPDHAPLANPLGRALGVPVLGHAPGPDFEPTGVLADGDRVTAGGVELTVVHTPGHSLDHLCFLAGKTLFTGDHIMGGGSSVMVDDVSAYMASLRRVKALRLERMLPGHGDPIDSPEEVVSWYIRHRQERERQILDAVRSGCSTVGEVVESVYAGVDAALYPLAARSVAAHLRKLEADGEVTVSGEAGWEGRVEPAR